MIERIQKFIFLEIFQVKSLFIFHMKTKNISFSSEIKCLLHENPDLKEIDEFSLKKYLAFGFIPGENSIFKKIKKLETGSFLTYCLDEGSLKKIDIGIFLDFRKAEIIILKKNYLRN